MNTIRQLRQAKNWTQKELAAMAGISSRAVAHHELGTKPPSERSLQGYAYALGVDAKDLQLPTYQVFTELEWRGHDSD